MGTKRVLLISAVAISSFVALNFIGINFYRISEKELRKSILTANKIVVKEGPFHNAEILYMSSDKKDIVELSDAIDIEAPLFPFRCKCLGMPAIFLYSNNRHLGTVTNHHAISINYNGWLSNAHIKNVDKYLSWFDMRGMTDVRFEYEHTK